MGLSSIAKLPVIEPGSRLVTVAESCRLCEEKFVCSRCLRRQCEKTRNGKCRIPESAHVDGKRVCLACYAQSPGQQHFTAEAAAAGT